MTVWHTQYKYEFNLAIGKILPLLLFLSNESSGTKSKADVSSKSEETHFSGGSIHYALKLPTR